MQISKKRLKRILNKVMVEAALKDGPTVNLPEGETVDEIFKHNDWQIVVTESGKMYLSNAPKKDKNFLKRGKGKANFRLVPGNEFLYEVIRGSKGHKWFLSLILKSGNKSLYNLASAVDDDEYEMTDAEKKARDEAGFEVAKNSADIINERFFTDKYNLNLAYVVKTTLEEIYDIFNQNNASTMLTFFNAIGIDPRTKGGPDFATISKKTGRLINFRSLKGSTSRIIPDQKRVKIINGLLSKYYTLLTTALEGRGDPKNKFPDVSDFTSLIKAVLRFGMDHYNEYRKRGEPKLKNLPTQQIDEIIRVNSRRVSDRLGRVILNADSFYDGDYSDAVVSNFKQELFVKI